jgi:NTE family protein
VKLISVKILYIAYIIGLGYSQSFSQQLSDSNKNYIYLNFKPKFNLDTNNFNVFLKKCNQKTTALVLSGGGARGFTQLGVLETLEKNNIDLDLVVGTSMGSVIGGLYSSGYSVKELKETFKEIDWTDKLSLTDKYQREALFLEQKQRQDKSLITISLDGFIPSIPSSISSGFQILEFLNVLFANTHFKPKNSFKDLEIPFIAVTTDFDKGERYDVKSGNISEAVKASLTFPLLYSPTIFNGKNLVDGGLTANIPVTTARENGADFVIAVNSTSPLREHEELDNPVNTADQVISITMAKLNEAELLKADIVLTPDIGNYQASNFTSIDFLIDRGKSKTSEMMISLKTKLDSLESSSSRYFNNFIINPDIKIESDFILDSLRDVILKSQTKNFLRFTIIEKTLKQLYNTGFYQNVYAEVFRDEFGPKLIYNLISNPILQDIKLNTKFRFLDTLIDNYKKTHNKTVINSISLYHLFENIYDVLRSNKISLAEISQFKLDYSTGVLNINITDGSFNDVILKGNNLTNNSVILRELKLSNSKILYSNDLEETLSNIYSTNLFKQISIDFDYSKDTLKPDLRINMVEKSSKNFRFSIRADNERKLQLLFDIRDENLFGTGNELSLNTNGGLRDREYKLDLKSNRFFNSFYTYKFSAYYNFRDIFSYVQNIDLINYEYVRTNVGEYRDTRYGLSFLLGKQLERLGTIYGQLFYEKQNINDNSAISKIQSEQTVLKIKVGSIIDTRNKIPFPMIGNLISFSYESAQDKFGGNISYSILNLYYEQYISIGKNSLLKPKFIFGFEDNTTPFTEQFSLGGENLFYGMVENELRGRQVLLTSLEYRYLFPVKLFFDTYISARYDLGQVWESAQDLRFKDLRHGVGLSIQFDTPVGKASFSGGRSVIINKGLSKNSFIWGPYTFYFSIGYDL